MVLAILLTQNIFLKVISIVSLIVLCCIKKVNVFDKKNIVKDIIYGFLVLFINIIVEFDLDVVNFAVLFVFGAVNYIFEVNMKREFYISIYLLLCL